MTVSPATSSGYCLSSGLPATVSILEEEVSWISIATVSILEEQSSCWSIALTDAGNCGPQRRTDEDEGVNP